MSNLVLSVRNLTVSFKSNGVLTDAVKQISFDITAGKTLAIVGESGSGKTLTALSITRLLPAAAIVNKQSDVFLEKQDVLELSEAEMKHLRGHNIGMIFQDAMAVFNPVLTIGDQVDEVLKTHFKLSKTERADKIIKLLEDVGIKDPAQCAASYAHQLSGGMRQRAMIALALAGEPTLLIADEPTTSIDVTLQKQILSLLNKLQAEHNMTILFITHDLHVVKRIADEVIVMRRGQIVEQATKENFFNQPQHEYSQTLLKMMPGWHNRKRPPLIEKPSKALLHADNFKVYFPIRKGLFKRTTGYVKAVDDVSFSLYPGHTLAVVGESGSGKTSLGRALLRLVRPTAGNAQFGEFNLVKLSRSELRPLRQQLQIIFQDPYTALNPKLLIEDSIQEAMRFESLNSEEKQTRIDELLDLVGISKDAKTRYPHEFSGGQLQRICIARALAVKPKLIVCDEITSALDVSIQMQILELLENLQDELKLTYLFITHNLDVVAYLADDVIVMQHGKLVESGPVEEIMKSPTHAYTKTLLNAVK